MHMGLNRLKWLRKAIFKISHIIKNGSFMAFTALFRLSFIVTGKTATFLSVFLAIYKISKSKANPFVSTYGKMLFAHFFVNPFMPH